MMQKFKRGGSTALCLIIVLSVLYCGVKFYKHEKVQQDRIASLEGKVSLLLAASNKSSIEWNSANYNYLAIGNSITIHPLNEYWWNECGMAATTAENDYVHLVASSLDAKFYAYNFSTWELMGHDRGETLSLLDGLLSEKLDLVTIQLSENATDLSTFESDFEELIRYVQKRAPDARLLVIGDFWDKKQKDAMKQKACEKTKVELVRLDEIKGLKKYQCGMGITVYDNNGNPHTVEHAGVANHPGDAGMKWIADRIVEVVKG